MLQHEYVRDRLTAALLSYHKPACNQVVLMALKSQDGCKFQDKPMREILMDETSVIVDAEPVRSISSRSYKSSTLPVAADIFRDISWRKAVNLLAPHYNAWINYCYGDSTNYEHQALLATHVWSAFLTLQKETDAPVMSKKTSAAIRALVYLAVQEAKIITNRGEAKYKPGELAQMMGVSHPSWTANHQPRWVSLLRICEQLDREALINAEFFQQKTRSNKR